MFFVRSFSFATVFFVTAFIVSRHVGSESERQQDRTSVFYLKTRGQVIRKTGVFSFEKRQKTSPEESLTVIQKNTKWASVVDIHIAGFTLPKEPPSLRVFDRHGSAMYPRREDGG